MTQFSPSQVSPLGVPGEENRKDKELITRWKAGDTQAATELVQRHADALARFAATWGGRGSGGNGGQMPQEEIEELVQDTFVRAFGAIDSFRGESSLRTWLFTIAKRLMLDRRRAEKRKWKLGIVSIDEMENSVAQTDYDALDDMVASEAEQQVTSAVQSLGDKQREIFLLRVEQGLSYKEIAEIVGTTEGAARVHYHNAMHSVKEYLRDSGDDGGGGDGYEA